MNFNFSRQLQAFLDMSVPYTFLRWTSLVLCLVFLYARIWTTQAFFIVGYALAIYILNLFIAFLSPRFDPRVDDYDESTGPQLPQTAEDEFRPFVRRLPEFRFWKKGMRGALTALFSTLFPFLDIPVFWPILLVYFFVLFFFNHEAANNAYDQAQICPFLLGEEEYNKSVTNKGKPANSGTEKKFEGPNRRYTARPV